MLFICLLSQRSSVDVTPQRNKRKHDFERALRMLRSSGAGGLVTVNIYNTYIYIYICIYIYIDR